MQIYQFLLGYLAYFTYEGGCLFLLPDVDCSNVAQSDNINYEADVVLMLYYLDHNISLCVLDSEVLASPCLLLVEAQQLAVCWFKNLCTQNEPDKVDCLGVVLLRVNCVILHGVNLFLLWLLVSGIAYPVCVEVPLYYYISFFDPLFTVY